MDPGFAKMQKRRQTERNGKKQKFAQTYVSACDALLATVSWKLYEPSGESLWKDVKVRVGDEVNLQAEAMMVHLFWGYASTILQAVMVEIKYD